MGHDDIIWPKALVLPVVEPAATYANAQKGTLVVSGVFLYLYTGAAWVKISSST